MLEKPQKEIKESREDLQKVQACVDNSAEAIVATEKKIVQLQEAKKKVSTVGGLGGGTLMFSSQAQGAESEKNFAQIQDQLKKAELQINQLQQNLALTLGETIGLGAGLGGSSKGKEEEE